jgi:benzoyl-CoA reductase/2-hydroxyglutaryl-CoA dehydratase subunit BcrC/BadD/HgdB
LKPEIMTRFDDFPEKFLIDIEALKEKGVKTAGLYCTFAPTEMVRAAGAVPVGLCGKKQTPVPAAERVLPTRLCPLIKSSYGYALTDSCPYFDASDFLVGETTCDGKKKMFELLKRLKPLYLMNLPYSYSDDQLKYWVNEIMALKSFVELQTGVKIEVEKLKDEIRMQNGVRTLLKDIMALSSGEVVPLSGLDMMIVLESKNYAIGLTGYAKMLRELYSELENRVDSGLSVCGTNAPRILLTGCPVGKGSEKVLRIVEECGGIVVCQENCTGLKSFDILVDEDEEPYTAIARRYLLTPCSCMTPNEGRLELLSRIVEQYNVQGIIDLTWFCCHTYNVETYSVKEFIQQRYALPFMHIETDYSESDLPQLRIRIEAFLEMIDNKF